MVGWLGLNFGFGRSYEFDSGSSGNFVMDGSGGGFGQGRGNNSVIDGGM